MSDWATFSSIQLPSLSSRGNYLSTDNTINIVFGVLAFVLGVLSVAFAWAMWLLARRDNRRRRQENMLMPTPDEDMELQRIARDHHGNFVTL
jgi:hypothetical protein